jgi:hypothetical protein
MIHKAPIHWDQDDDAQSASDNNTKHVRDQVDKALYFIISAHLRTLARPQYHSTILAQTQPQDQTTYS